MESRFPVAKGKTKIFTTASIYLILIFIITTLHCYFILSLSRRILFRCKPTDFSTSLASFTEIKCNEIISQRSHYFRSESNDYSGNSDNRSTSRHLELEINQIHSASDIKKSLKPRVYLYKSKISFLSL